MKKKTKSNENRKKKKVKGVITYFIQLVIDLWATFF